jgi:hypothetical protein
MPVSIVLICGIRCAWHVKNCLVSRGAAVLNNGNDLKMDAIVVEEQLQREKIVRYTTTNMFGGNSRSTGLPGRSTALHHLRSEADTDPLAALAVLVGADPASLVGWSLATTIFGTICRRQINHPTTPYLSQTNRQLFLSTCSPFNLVFSLFAPMTSYMSSDSSLKPA